VSVKVAWTLPGSLAPRNLANVIFPNLDGDFVDAPGRRKNRSGGSGRGQRTAADLLTFGWW